MTQALADRFTFPNSAPRLAPVDLPRRVHHPGQREEDQHRSDQQRESLEAFSLLIGSVLIFFALAGVMYATRQIDWSKPRGTVGESEAVG